MEREEKSISQKSPPTTDKTLNISDNQPEAITTIPVVTAAIPTITVATPVVTATTQRV